MNNSNYLLCTQSFKVFVGALRYIKYLLEGLPNEKDLPIQIGLLMVVTWLRNSMEDIVNLDVVFLKTAKEI